MNVSQATETPSAHPARPTAGDQLTQDLGLLTLAFFSDWIWIERRVESVTFPDEVTVRRRISVDFAVPDEWVSPVPTIPGEPPTFYVPLAMLRKQGLMRFDLCDETGRALPLLTRDQNGLVAQATLLQLAMAINLDRGEPMTGAVPAELQEELSLITDGSADRALVVWDALDKDKKSDCASDCAAWRTFLTAEDKFMALAHDFAIGFPLIVPVTGMPGVRRIVKFSYQASAPPHRPSSRWRQLARGVGWRPRTELISTPSIGKCRCFHLEVQAPDGLQITRGKLSGRSKPKPTVWDRALPDVIKPGSERVHMHVNALGVSEGTAVVNLRARPSTISRAALATALLTTIAIALACWRHDVLEANPGPAVSLLLLVPTALSVYVARPREPVITTGLLLGQRVLAVSCGLLAIAAAAVLVAGQECDVAKAGMSCQQWQATPWLLGGLAAAAAVIAMVLTATVVFTSWPPEKKGFSTSGTNV